MPATPEKKRAPSHSARFSKAVLSHHQASILEPSFFLLHVRSEMQSKIERPRPSRPTSHRERFQACKSVAWLAAIGLFWPSPNI